ncbi:unnamed protein product, partial [Ectocarpus fasciculatus]
MVGNLVSIASRRSCCDVFFRENGNCTSILYPRCLFVSMPRFWRLLNGVRVRPAAGKTFLKPVPLPQPSSFGPPNQRRTERVCARVRGSETEHLLSFCVRIHSLLRRKKVKRTALATIVRR